MAVAGMQFDGNAALVISTFALVFAAEWGRQGESITAVESPFRRSPHIRSLLSVFKYPIATQSLTEHHP